MADSVRELILKNIKTTLEGVTVVNGYANTLASVQRFLQPGQTLASVPMVLVLEGEDDATQGPLSGAYGLTSRTLNVGLMILARQDMATATVSASEAMNSLIADVQKVLQVAPTRGGYAVDTQEISVSPIEANEGMTELACTLAYSITYRHRRDDPTIAG